MFAVITIGSKQYRIRPKEKILVDRMKHKEGEEVSLGDVLLVMKNKKVDVGTPRVVGASVKARVVKHVKGEKVIVFKYKPKKRYQKKIGARASLTELEILDVVLGKTTKVSKTKVKRTTKN